MKTINLQKELFRIINFSTSFSIAFCICAAIFGTNLFWVSVFLFTLAYILKGFCVYLYYRIAIKHDKIETPEQDGVTTMSGNGRKRGGGTQPK